jgi:hypothetical protein
VTVRASVPLIEIDQVIRLEPTDGPDPAITVDRPTRGELVDGFILKVAGSVQGRFEKPPVLKLRHDDRAHRTIPVAVVEGAPPWSRPFTSAPRRLRFSTAVGVLGLPPRFEVTLGARFGQRSPTDLAIIRGTHQPLQTEFRPRRQPLMVTSLPRTGTTWAMRLLGEHPAVLMQRRHPYEMQSGRYWMHVLKILSEPANHLESSQPNSFAGDLHRIGHNPFFAQGLLTGASDLERWFSRDYLERLATFCLQMTEAYYDRVSEVQREADATYFVEKHGVDHIQWIMWELYSQTREVFLVRDPKDMFASMVAFNEKRGHAAFGRQRVQTDEEWLERVRVNIGRFEAAWKARSDRAHLVRYEDLVADPGRELASIFDYLGVDASAATVQGVMRGAGKNSRELRGHRTTASPEASIGSWRRLDPRWWSSVDEVFTGSLTDLGYD